IGFYLYACVRTRKTYRYGATTTGRYMQGDEDDCIRCGGRMVNVGFQIYRCQNCGHEEKPEDVM
ncbi:MAG: hypothetical protein ABI347_04075, partial [Nitrososphaera sp.]